MHPWYRIVAVANMHANSHAIRSVWTELKSTVLIKHAFVLPSPVVANRPLGAGWRTATATSGSCSTGTRISGGSMLLPTGRTRRLSAADRRLSVFWSLPSRWSTSPMWSLTLRPTLEWWVVWVYVSCWCHCCCCHCYCLLLLLWLSVLLLLLVLVVVVMLLWLSLLLLLLLLLVVVIVSVVVIVGACCCDVVVIVIVAIVAAFCCCDCHCCYCCCFLLLLSLLLLLSSSLCPARF